MIRRLIWNDIKHNKLLSGVTILFMTLSAMLLALTVMLFTGLLSSIDYLMEKAQTPDFLQMHAGTINEDEMAQFVQREEGVQDWQICRFLNLENDTIRLGNYALTNSTQDNGLCVQGKAFDYLLDTDNNMPVVLPGQIYVPVCYRGQYHLKIGDTLYIGKKGFYIAGFIRDSQMNAMMASSKRFLVNEADYEMMKAQGVEEYLIEFLLKDGTDVNAFNTNYMEEKLPANGPTITKPLIKMMNALSDGMMILVIFIVSIVAVLISILCIRFILLTRIEKERKEAGMLKALGIGKREIRQLYFAKYIMFSLIGALTGFLVAWRMHKPLAEQMQELYGPIKSSVPMGTFALLAIFLVEMMILFCIKLNLKKIEGLSALEALFSVQNQKEKGGKGQKFLIAFVVAVCVGLMLIPQNLYSTLSSSKFVTYMGIGNGEIRIDVRQTENIETKTQELEKSLKSDTRVKKFTVLQTKSYLATVPKHISCNLMIEEGDHTVFPVSYIEGREPVDKNELALSTLNAKELGLSIGDVLYLKINESLVPYKICGIYSDITNGGKTAKMATITDENDIKDKRSVMWSVIYASLKKDVSRESWIQEYRNQGADVVQIAEYIKSTYGQTLQEIKRAAKATTMVALLIIFIVVALFMRLIIEKERGNISLKKALGFTSQDIQKSYMIKGMLLGLSGILLGLLIGNGMGEKLCGIVLKILGADGFRFVIEWKTALITIPIYSMFAAGVAIWTGIAEIKKVKAFECCRGKE